MMDLTHRVGQNQETFLRVVLSPRLSLTKLTELISALQGNESLRRVEILCCGSFVPRATLSLWQSLLGALLGLPNLQSFQMRGCSTATSFNDAHSAIPVTAWTAALQNSSCDALEFFSLSALMLNGSPQDFISLAGAFQAKKSLREFEFLSIGLVDDVQQTGVADSTTTLVLEPLLTSLASLPLLENLEVSGTFTPLGVLESVPPLLFRSPSLKRLSISDWIFPETVLARVLEDDLLENHRLQELAISGNVTRRVMPSLTRLLERNSTLQAVALRLDDLRDEVRNRELAVALGASRLRVVSLCRFFGPDCTAATRTAFCQMLESNDTIEYLYVPCPPTDRTFWDTVRFYCGLNARGRRLQPPKSVEEEEKKDDCEPEICRSSYSKNIGSATPLTPTRFCKPSLMISPGKRHQRMVTEVQSAKRRKFPLVPNQVLSSMLLMR